MTAPGSFVAAQLTPSCHKDQMHQVKTVPQEQFASCPILQRIRFVAHGIFSGHEIGNLCPGFDSPDTFWSLPVAIHQIGLR
jgi:hypothetical protein